MVAPASWCPVHRRSHLGACHLDLGASRGLPHHANRHEITFKASPYSLSMYSLLWTRLNVSKSNVTMQVFRSTMIE